MAEQDQKHIGNSRKTADQEADRVLDAALAKYASVEPRAGLEARILANLCVAKMRTPERAWWRLNLAAAATAVLVVAMFFSWRSVKPAHPVDAAVEPSPQGRGTQIALNSGSLVRRNRTTPLQHLPRSRPQTVAEAVPKLDQFPSPQPLSEQEKMLRSYVAEAPDEAVLIARVANEEIQRDRAEIIDTPQGRPPSAARGEQETTNR